MSSMTLDIGTLLNGLGKHKGKKHSVGYSYASPYLTGLSGMGKVTFAPTSPNAPLMFLGFIAAPAALGIVDKVASNFDFYKIDDSKEKMSHYVKLGAFAASAGINYLGFKGQSSFWFGATLAQIPAAAETIGNFLSDAIAKIKGAGTKGLSSSQVDELRRIAVGSVITDQSSANRRLSGVTTEGLDSTGHASFVGSPISDQGMVTRRYN